VTALIQPRTLRLESSTHCQLRCPSCPTTTGAIDAALGKGFLRFDDFRKLVDENRAIREIELSNYGEIFLNRDLVPILEYARQKRVAITIDNGANLNHATEEALEAIVRTGVRKLVCSIDGATQETYAIYRVRGDFDRVIGNIETINRFKKKYRSRTPALRWQFVVFGHNEHEIPLARKRAEELGMRFVPKLTWDDEFSPIRDPEYVRRELGLETIDRAGFRQKTGVDYREFICGHLWSSPQINWNGDVLGCGRNFWGTFGANAFREGLGPAVNSERMNYARQMLTGAAPARDDIPCTTCSIYLDRAAARRWVSPSTLGRKVSLIRRVRRILRRIAVTTGLR
jgi:MoaA/NifB/PqqE/SkfB family radical SAM enzyme